LDADFATEIHATIQRAVTMPLTNRFPYEALYALDGRSIYMLAVMHMRRQPGYWRARP